MPSDGQMLRWHGHRARMVLELFNEVVEFYRLQVVLCITEKCRQPHYVFLSSFELDSLICCLV